MKCPRCASKNIKPYANGFGIGYYCVDCNDRRKAIEKMKSLQDRIDNLEKRLTEKEKE
jgi:uncharacterized protein (DUF2164 family)